MEDSTGARVRRAREERVIGQAELAREAGLSQSSLWHIEHGNRNPLPRTLRRLAEAMTTLSGRAVNPSDLQHTAREEEKTDGR